MNQWQAENLAVDEFRYVCSFEGLPIPSEEAVRSQIRADYAMERIWDAPPPTPVNRNVDEVLEELGIANAGKDWQRKVVAREAWRLHPEEVGWLNGAGLTDLTPEHSRLMLKGYSEAEAREEVSRRKR